jgi:hypothetical protein
MVMRTALALSLLSLVAASTVAHAQDQAVAVGPWTITVASKADHFDNCSMTRSTADLNVSFVRTTDGLFLLLDSSKWRLDRGKTYSVTLVAGQRSVNAQAIAETKGVTIALSDRPLNERLRSSSVLEVIGEGATLRVPLDGSTAALARLESCFEKNSRQDTDTNPFVAPNRKP